MINIYVWEAKLIVQRRALEFKLDVARKKHSELVDYRNRYTPRSVAWNEYDKMIRTKREAIRDLLEQISFVRDLAYAGPIVGGELHVPGDHGYRGPSILDLFDREAKKFDDTDEWTKERQALADGIRHAKDVLVHPYNYLNEQERVGYDMAEKAAKKADDEQRARIGNDPGPKRGPGRPRGSTNAVRNVPPPKNVPKATVLRINPDTGKAERTGM